MLDGLPVKSSLWSRMALPPTELTLLLYRSGADPGDILRELAARGWLRADLQPPSPAVTEELTRAIEAIEAELAAQPEGWTGPSMPDRIARKLASLGWLSEEGRAAADQRARGM